MTVFSDYLAQAAAFQSVTPPPLMGGRGAGGLADEFATRFGQTWRRTPVKGTWVLMSHSIQFTCRRLADGGLDIGLYQYDTAEEFKAAFEANRLEDPIWFQWEMNSPHKYPYLAMREKLMQAGYRV